MKRNEVLIGRQVGDGNYQVDEKFKAVSRVHAKLNRKSDGVYIEDMDSPNGVYVNGCRVKSKKVSRADKIFLGGCNHYELDLTEAIKLFPLSDAEFSQKMHELEQVYLNYQSQSSELQTKGQENMMTKRMLPTMLLGVITTLLTVTVDGDVATKAAIGVVGAILSVVVFLLATKWATKSNKEMKEKLNRLNEEYELDYVCPSCMASFRGKSWKSIDRLGKCPACQRDFN